MAMFKLKIRGNGLVREEFPDYKDKLTVSTANKAKIGAANLYLKTYGEKYIEMAIQNNKSKESVRNHLTQVHDVLFERGYVDSSAKTILNTLLADKDDRYMFSELIKQNEKLFPPSIILDSELMTSDNPKAMLFGAITQDVFEEINSNFDKLLITKLM